jgi:AmiR/NasT family two-component response regulator
MESKIIIGIDSEVIELTGADKEAFLAQRVKDQAEYETRLAEAQAKAQAKAVLLERLGLTQEEFNILTAQS